MSRVENTVNGCQEFDLEVLLTSLTKASNWQLKIRGCLDPAVCANDLAKDWTYGGKPVAAGKFLILRDKIIVFIPGAVNPEKVLHSLVVHQARAWKRKCERCRFGSCAIVEDFEDPEEPRHAQLQLVNPANPADMLAEMLLFEEILAQIENPKHRQVFDLKYRYGYSAEEIGKLLGIRATTVRQWIFRETGKLRAIFVPA